MRNRIINNQLPVPQPATLDQHATEIIRVWIANKNQHFSLRIGLWNDPAAWGILLADLAKNIAKSYEQEAAVDSTTALERIVLAFKAELEDPTER